MEIHHQVKENICVLYLSGRMNATNASKFKKYVTDLVNDGYLTFICDMSDLKFIDSSGLGALVSFMRKVSSQKGSISLSGLSEEIQSLFELTRMHKIFDIYTTCEDALHAVQ